MTPTQSWKTLGIEPTNDRSTIRRAYAQRLKLTNPEDDAAGFQDLRAAYDYCLARGAATYDWPADEDEQDLLEEDGEREPAYWSPVASDPAPAGHESICTPGGSEPSAGVSHWRRLARLERMLEQGAGAVDLGLALDDLLSDAGLENVGIHSATESSLASLIVQHGAGADPIIRAAAAYFGWAKGVTTGEWLPEQGWILQRLGVLDHIAKLTDPSFTDHQAYLALMSPPPAGRDLKTARRLANGVKRIFQMAEREAPGLFGHFDADSAEWWQAYLAKNPPKLAVAKRGAITGLTALLRVAFSIGLIMLSLSTCSHLFGDREGRVDPMKAYREQVMTAQGESTASPPSVVAKLRADSLSSPNSAVQWADLCHTLAHAQRVEGDWSDCNRAVNLGDVGRSSLLDRALLKQRAGYAAAAIEDYSAVLVPDPDQPIAQYGRGLARIAIGQVTAGAKEMRAALRTDPDLARLFASYRIPPGLRSLTPNQAKAADMDLLPTTYSAPRVVGSPPASVFSAVYPTQAARQKLGGEAKVQCAVSLEGRAEHCVVRAESPIGAGFGRAAVKAMAQYRFKPAMRQGVPIANVQVAMTLRFWIGKPKK